MTCNPRHRRTHLGHSRTYVPDLLSCKQVDLQVAGLPHGHHRPVLRAQEQQQPATAPCQSDSKGSLVVCVAGCSRTWSFPDGYSMCYSVLSCASCNCCCAIVAVFAIRPLRHIKSGKLESFWALPLATHCGTKEQPALSVRCLQLHYLKWHLVTAWHRVSPFQGQLDCQRQGGASVHSSLSQQC